MKALGVFLRIIIIGCLWCIIFTEGIRVIMLCNWHFDIFWPDHWRYLFNVWKEGWTARAPKEWAFVILLVTFIPMLITGWWTLSMVSWETILWKIITFPLWLYRRFIKAPLNVITTNNPYGIVKRKSYKQVRPTGVSSIRVPISDYGNTSSVAKQPAPSALPSYSSQPSYLAPSSSAVPSSAAKKTDVSAAIDHALFKFDDDDDDFDLDIDSFEKADIKKDKPVEVKKSAPKFEFDDDDDEDNDIEDFKPRRDTKPRNDRKSTHERSDNRSNNDRNRRNDERKNSNNKQSAPERNSGVPVFEALQQKNYDVISNITVKGTKIDFVGVSESEICLCLVDKEVGDWLADEEMFNGEEPLWFSESSHRVSPVCLLNNALPIIKDALDDGDFTQEVSAFVVIQSGNIINADDMFEVWDNMHIKVTRINRGSPKEIPLFSKTLEEADGSMDKQELGRLSKILKNLR